MKALISPIESILDQRGNFLGNRVVEFSERGFEVADPYFWVEFNDVVVDPSICYFDSGSIHTIPADPVEEPEVI